ncbi:MAG: hypothetical protein Q7U04_17040 [Bacteriovorax sp.]|nr:hypothetical protein [Bacteriovorax sp.]
MKYSILAFILLVVMTANTNASTIIGSYLLFSGDKNCQKNLIILQKEEHLIIKSNENFGPFFNTDGGNGDINIMNINQRSQFDYFENKKHTIGTMESLLNETKLSIIVNSITRWETIDMYEVEANLDLIKVDDMVQLKSKILYNEFGIDSADFITEMKCLYSRAD